MKIPLPITTPGFPSTARCARYLLYAIILAPLLTACGSRDIPPPVHQETLLAFGTLIDVTLWGVDEQLAQEAFEAIRDDFNYMHNTWHAWQPSALDRINSLLKTGAPFSVAPSILPLITRAGELSRLSSGLFNPAIGKLIGLWGFHSEELIEGVPPDSAAIAELVARQPSMDDIVMDGISIRGVNPAVQLDFGGFAKGAGLDVVIEHLRELGIENAIVNAGGDLRAIGSHGERPWRVGIRDPSGEGILAGLETSGDESIVTSGNYERFFEYDGKRFHHIIDPRTGYPAMDTASVTVIHQNAATADAAATALFVAGAREWHTVAKAMGIKYVMLITASGEIHLNPAFAARISFNTDTPPALRISEPL